MGEGWVGVMPVQGLCNRRVDAFDIRQHLMVPHPEDPITLMLQETVAFGFGRCRCVVLAAIDLDNQTRAVADKIDDVGSDRHLTANFKPVDLMGPQDGPKVLFRLGPLSSQGSGPIAGAVDRILLHFKIRSITPTLPSPIEREGFTEYLFDRRRGGLF
jgi:hypothetical protein